MEVRKILPSRQSNYILRRHYVIFGIIVASLISTYVTRSYSNATFYLFLIHHTRHEERRTCQGNLKKEKYKTETTRNCYGNPKKKNEKDENALRERI